MTKDEEIVNLKAENTLLLEKYKALEKKVELLLRLLEKKDIKKDSHNSHNSPSQDKHRPKRNQSLRKKSNRKPGGQIGHKGNTLEININPDKIELLRSNFCQSCGSDLRKLEHALVSKRQEVIIPPIEPKFIEYQQYGCLCGCGHHQKGTYPSNISALIQFGSDIIALVSYFNVFQYVPYHRLTLLFKDVFNLPMSEGSIGNLLKKAAKKSTPIYDAILENIKIASYVGSDETGAKVNGKKWWIWVCLSRNLGGQTAKDTFLKTSKSRGFEIVEQTFPEGLPNTIIGSDRWAAQLKIVSKSKQLCFPHLLRDLNYLIETEKNDWSNQFKLLLKQALKLKETSLEINKAFEKEGQQMIAIEEKLNKLLGIPILKDTFPLTLTFQKQMIKHRNFLFTFLYHLEVPPDNNASERAIRNVKVKQKISGQFKSGQEAFCIIRSLIDTFRKRNLNVLDKLKIIMAN